MSDSCQISFQIHTLGITKHPYGHLLFPLDPAFFLSEFLWMIFPAIASYLSAMYCTVEMGEAYGVSSKCMQCTHRPRQIHRCSPSPRSERTAEFLFFWISFFESQQGRTGSIGMLTSIWWGKQRMVFECLVFLLFDPVNLNFLSVK